MHLSNTQYCAYVDNDSFILKDKSDHQLDGTNKGLLGLTPLTLMLLLS